MVDAETKDDGLSPRDRLLNAGYKLATSDSKMISLIVHKIALDLPQNRQKVVYLEYSQVW